MSSSATDPSANSVVVYTGRTRADFIRALLTAACRSTGTNASLDVSGPGGLFRRLSRESQQPQADLVLTFGPHLAQAAGINHYLEPYQPRATAALIADASPLATHAESWSWTAVAFSPFRLVGPRGTAAFIDLLGPAVPILGMADPLRDEGGLLAVLCFLDGIRQTQGSVGPGWTWWQSRIDQGVRYGENDASAVTLVAGQKASHALTLLDASTNGNPLSGLPPLPTVVGLVRGAPHAADARKLMDWLTSNDAASEIETLGGLSHWRAAVNGLEQLGASAPPLDVGWTLEQFRVVREEWQSRKYSPAVALAG